MRRDLSIVLILSTPSPPSPRSPDLNGHSLSTFSTRLIPPPSIRPKNFPLFSRASRSSRRDGILMPMKNNSHAHEKKFSWARERGAADPEKPRYSLVLNEERCFFHPLAHFFRVCAPEAPDWVRMGGLLTPKNGAAAAIFFSVQRIFSTVTPNALASSVRLRNTLDK